MPFGTCNSLASAKTGDRPLQPATSTANRQDAPRCSLTWPVPPAVGGCIAYSKSRCGPEMMLERQNPSVELKRRRRKASKDPEPNENQFVK